MATNYDDVTTVRALSPADVRKMNNTQLKKALTTVLVAEVAEWKEEPSNTDLLTVMNDIKGTLEKVKVIEAKYNEILTEMKDLKETKEEVKVLKEQYNRMNEKLEAAFQIIHQQQLYMESNDNRERRRNLVVTGVH